MITKGQRVTVILEIEKFPNGSIPEGYHGFISTISDEYIGVTLDRFIPWLNVRNDLGEWKNEIHILADDLESYQCETLEELFWVFFEKEPV
jgi:hypothetical protein